MKVPRAARVRTAAGRPSARETTRRRDEARRREAAGSAAPAPDGRARILAVAIRQFSERGYEGATTASIAREAEVTQPLVHHHFGSKEGLWREAMEQLFAPVGALATLRAGSAAEDLLRIAEEFVRFVSERPEVTRVISREGASATPRLRHLVDRHLRGPFESFVARLRDAQAEGVVAPAIRAELLLFLVLGAGSHLFDVTALASESLGVDTSAADTREHFVALFGELLRHGVLTDPAATPKRSRRRGG